MDLPPSLHPIVDAVSVAVADHVAGVVVVVANMAVPVDLVCAIIPMSQTEEDCSKPFDLVACLKLCTLIVGERRSVPEILMPLCAMKGTALLRYVDWRK